MRRKQVSDKAKSRYKNNIRSFFKSMGRRILVYKNPIYFECDNCFYDKVNNKSTGKCKWTMEEAKLKQEELESKGINDIRYKYFIVGRCPICKGEGRLKLMRKVWLDCMVSWNRDNKYVNTPGGFEGSSTANITTEPKYMKLFKECSSVVIDGLNCKVATIPVIKGLGNQSTLSVTVYTVDKVNIDKGAEVYKDYS